MKRAHSQASPPPHASGSSIQLPKGKKQKANLNVNSNAATPLASSPPQFRSRSRSRSRSTSLAPPNPAKGKKKEAPPRHVDDEDPSGLTAGGADPDNDNDEEEEMIDYSDDEFGMDQKANMAMKEDLRVLLQHFDEEQMDRYESYRRSGLAKASVRRLVNQVLSQSVSPSVLTVVRGFAKVFVGEIVEKAKSVAKHDGPLTPSDLREAYRIYLLEHEGAGKAGGGKKKMFVK